MPSYAHGQEAVGVGRQVQPARATTGAAMPCALPAVLVPWARSSRYGSTAARGINRHRLKACHMHCMQSCAHDQAASDLTLATKISNRGTSGGMAVDAVQAYSRCTDQKSCYSSSIFKTKAVATAPSAASMDGAANKTAYIKA
jgi:hypothetical protein